MVLVALAQDVRTRSLRTLAVSDLGWAKTTRRNSSSSSERSSILLTATAESPARPTDSGVRAARPFVSYPSRCRKAIRASAEVRSVMSLGVRSRSVVRVTSTIPRDKQERCGPQRQTFGS